MYCPKVKQARFWISEGIRDHSKDLPKFTAVEFESLTNLKSIIMGI